MLRILGWYTFEMFRPAVDILKVYTICIALSPALLLPVIPISSAQKGLCVALVTAVTLIFFGIKTMMGRDAHSLVRLEGYTIAVFIFLASVGASALFGYLNGVRNFWGASMEVGTSGSVLVFVAAMLLVSSAQRNVGMLFLRVCVLTIIGVLALSLALAHSVSPEAEARPSLVATKMIIVPLYLESFSRALFGEGGAGVSNAWEKYRTRDINDTPLWNYPVYKGYSDASTIAISFGAIGFLALFLVPILVVYAFFHSASRENSVVEIGLVSVCVLSFLFVFAYSGGLVSLAFAGASIGAYANYRVRSAKEASVSVHPILNVCLGASCLVIGVVVSFVAVAQFPALRQYERALLFLETKDERLFNEMKSTSPIWSVAKYDIAVSRAYAANAEYLLANTKGNPEDLGKAQDDFITAVQISDSAAIRWPKDVQMWLQRAELFSRLTALGYPNALQYALESIDQAASLSPLHPLPPLFKALIAHSSGNRAMVRLWARESLWRKGDLPEGLRLLEITAQPNI